MDNPPLIVDVRGLECPKPFQRAQAEAMMLSPGDSFKLHISMRPQPLLDFLQQHNFSYKVEQTPEGEFLIQISANSDSIQLDNTVVEPPSGCAVVTT